jgi:hypothetical protein
MDPLSESPAGSSSRRALAVVLAAGVIATAVIAGLHRLVGPSGLLATVALADQTLDHPLDIRHDGGVSRHSAHRLAQSGDGQPVRISWTGYLLAAETREYEVRVFSDAAARLWLDSRLVFDNRRDTAPARLALTAGQHLVTIDLRPAGAPQEFDFQWDVGNRHRLDTVSLDRLSPRRLNPWQWTLRPWLRGATNALCLAWCLVLLWVGSLPVRRFARRELPSTAPLGAAFAGTALVCAAGIWWSAMGAGAPDEISPAYLLDAVAARFGGDWYPTIYPPLHYYVLAAATSPFIAADAWGWLTTESESTHLLFVLAMRAVSVVMALATLVAVALLATRVLDRRHAWLAVLCAGTFLPFAYYAKTANVDGPALCWFAWSLVFLVRYAGNGRLRDALALGALAAAAVGTKDQYYALYVGPALALVWWHGRSRSGWLTLAAGAAIAILVLAAIYNVPFNPSALTRHVEFITGGASSGYRAFAPTPHGQWLLFRTTAGQMLGCLGVAGLVLVVASARTRAMISPRAGIVLLLAVLSYYVALLAVVGYVYDRFLLPVAVIAALPAAAGARRLLDGGRAARRAACVLLAWLALRALSLDLLMMRDSRRAAEAWLHAHVERGQSVASVVQDGYLPRLDDFNWMRLQPDTATTLEAAPDFIVVNRDHAERFGSDARQWVEWLESGRAPYETAFRRRASTGWLPLALDRRFVERGEDAFTNLDKVSPEIAIFRKKRRE